MKSINTQNMLIVLAMTFTAHTYAFDLNLALDTVNSAAKVIQQTQSTYTPQPVQATKVTPTKQTKTQSASTANTTHTTTTQGFITKTDFIKLQNGENVDVAGKYVEVMGSFEKDIEGAKHEGYPAHAYAKIYEKDYYVYCNAVTPDITVQAIDQTLPESKRPSPWPPQKIIGKIKSFEPDETGDYLYLDNCTSQK